MSETKSSRQQQKTTARKRRQRRTRVSNIGVPLLALVVIATGIGIWLNRDDTPLTIDGVQTFDVAPAKHVQQDVKYAQYPPVGGDHFGVWQNCGAYSNGIIEEQGVHSLEHGAVWITYKSSLPNDQINELRSLSRKFDYVLVSPISDLSSPVVASAWKAQLRLESASDPRLTKFLRKYVQGPDTPEIGAPCTNGAGKPT